MIKNKKMISKLLLVAGTSLLLSSCVSTSDNNADPFENFNRSVFAFNEVVDDALINPTITVYRAVVPNPVRSGFKNFLFNLRSPLRFINQVLQADVSGAGNEFVRAAVNTFVGVGGIFDVAAYEGLESEYEDFGQTLAVWGVGQGPYVVVPFLGPSTMRDYVGFAVDSFFDPIRFYARNADKNGRYYTKLGADYLNLRDDLMDILNELEMSSIDYYAAVRSTYLQSREALVNDHEGGQLSVPVIPDFDDDEF